MSYWNYRVLTDGKTHWVGEVYYDHSDKPIGFTDPNSGVLEDWESLEELKNTVRLVVLALDKPVLVVDESHDSLVSVVLET